jgi:hypothetical protein
MSPSRVTSALFLSVLVIATGCGKRAEVASSSTTETSATAVQTSAPTTAAGPASNTAPPGAAAVAATPPATVIASGNYSGDANIRADLLEVRRVSGGALLVKWRVVNTSPDKPASYTFGWGDVYYVDPAENKKYGFLTDSEGNRILDIWYGTLQPGEQRGNWAKFPAPPPTSNKISISLPKFPPFEDAPVS